MAATSKNTPMNDVMAMLGLITEASIPNKETIAKVLIPTSLLDHSRSIPANIPMPIATAILCAMGVAGKCTVSICILLVALKLILIHEDAS